MMEDLNTTREIIRDHEKKFASELAGKILHKPKLSVWMVLIPFIFIFYLTDLSKYKNKRKEFIQNHLLSREKALDEAVDALKETRKPDTYNLAAQTKLNKKALVQYAEFLSVLADHYTLLLQKTGHDYKTIVLSAYGKDKKKFTNYMQTLIDKEAKLNRSLVSSIKENKNDIKKTIKNIETHSSEMKINIIKDIYN